MTIENGAAPTVAVTGASGYIATELVKQLLEKGYSVRATVRNPNNESKVAHLRALAAALPGTLRLFVADLLQYGSFDEAIRGTSVVFHTASPYFADSADPQTELIDPDVQGTKNVLGSVVKSRDSVKRVVMTSSVAAVLSMKNAPPKNGSLFTEEDWNEQSTLETEPYFVSKVLAEKAAWEIAKKEGLDLMTINPIYVIGPVINAQTNATSIQLLQGVLEGKETLFNTSATGYIDVRDVARAHILAAENPKASGRYILSHAATTPAAAVTNALKKRCPGIDLIDGPPGKPATMMDSRKVTEGLGMKPIPADESFADMASTMVQLGLAHPRFQKSAASQDSRQ